MGTHPDALHRKESAYTVQNGVREESVEPERARGLPSQALLGPAEGGQELGRSRSAVVIDKFESSRRANEGRCYGRRALILQTNGCPKKSIRPNDRIPSSAPAVGITLPAKDPP